jgi:hypothetical protein
MQFLNMWFILKKIVSGDYGWCGHMGLGQIDFWELTKPYYSTQFGFYAPRPNCQHVLEWLEDVS